MFDPKARTLEGKKGLVIGIANDKSIAYGCAKAFKFLGADGLAVTYLNDKARPHVQPLAEEIGAGITFAIARANRPITALLDHYGALDSIGRERLYPSNRHAVAAYRKERPGNVAKSSEAKAS
jgi:hypothetical protein